MIAIDSVELAPAALLAIEELQHYDSGDVLLQVSVNFGDGHADAPVALLHGAAEDQGSYDHDRHGRHQNTGEQRAHAVHDDDDESEHHQIAEDRHQAGREEVVEHVDVGGHAGYQAAHGIAVVEGEVEPLQMFHELLAQVEHGELAGLLHQVGLGELGDKRCHQDGDVEQGDARESGPGVGGQPGIDRRVERAGLGANVLVDRQAGEQRVHYLEDGLRQQEQHGKGDEGGIGPHVAQQPAHQTGVIRFAEDLFFHVFSG